MKLNVDREFNGYPLALYRWTVRILTRTMNTYHPVFLGERRISAGERACLDRWEIIGREIEQRQIATVLDLGCAEGFFVQQAARDYGCTALGVDADVRRLTLAQSTSTLRQIHGAGFMLGMLTPELIERLPRSDLVLFLSVLHHVMYEHGPDYAREMLSCIRARTRRAMIFDMGQSNETANAWAELLPSMEPDPETWIRTFLLSAGFSSAERIGETDSYQSRVRRVVFLAEP